MTILSYDFNNSYSDSDTLISKEVLVYDIQTQYNGKFSSKNCQLCITFQN